MRIQILLRSLLLFLGVTALAQGDPVGLWEFDNPANLVQATVGNDLVLRGGGQSAVAGIDGSDGAVAIPSGTYYRCAHGISANGGGSYVNEFTLLFDVMYPQASAGQWRALYQTNWANSNDADYFIHPTDESWGVGALGYTNSPSVGQWYSSHSVWYRAVLTVNLDDNPAAAFHDLYINGELKGKHLTSSLSLDGRFSLYPSSSPNPYIVFSGDDNGEDALLYFSNIAIWDHALTAQEVAALGGPGDPILGSHPGISIAESDGGTSVKEGSGPDTYEIVLRSAPSSNVEVIATPGDNQIDLGGGPGVPAALQFAPGDWDTPRSVSVIAVDDDVYEGKTPHTTVIHHTATSSDDGYNDIAIRDVEVRVLDDELTCGDWGYLRSDLNRDCYVNFLDFAIFIDMWIEYSNSQELTP